MNKYKMKMYMKNKSTIEVEVENELDVIEFTSLIVEKSESETILTFNITNENLWVPFKNINMMKITKVLPIENPERFIQFKESKTTVYDPAPEDVTDVNSVEWQTEKEVKDVEIATPSPKKGDIVVYWDSKYKSINRRWGIMTGFNTGICEIKRIEENGIVDHVLINSIEQINPAVESDFKIGDKIAYRKAGYDMYSCVDVVKDIGQANGTLYVQELEDDEITEVDPKRVIKVLDRAATETEAPVIEKLTALKRYDQIIYLNKGIKHRGQVIGIHKENVYVIKVLDVEYSGTHTIKLNQVERVINNEN